MPVKTGLKHILGGAEELRKMPEDAGKSPPLFLHFPPYSETDFGIRFRGFALIDGHLKFRQTFSAFSAALRVHRLACPVATGKNAGDDAA